MPAINTRKLYRSDSYYHIYNRGAHKLDVFLTDEDYVYIGRLLQESVKKWPAYIRAFSVLPNHFHLLLFQSDPVVIAKFMHFVGTYYGVYLHEKYEHSGRVFQGVYKAALKKGKRQIEQCEEYILQNPQKAGLKNWPYVGKNIFEFGKGNS